MRSDTWTLLTELERLRRRLDEISDREIRQRRLLGDLLYNLDTENMPAVKKLIEQYRTASGESLASVSTMLDETGARVSALAERQSATESAVARAEAAVSDHEASITALASQTGETENGLAALTLRTEKNETEILSLVSHENATDASIAALESRADENEAELFALAEWRSSAEDGIAALSSVEAVANEANAKASLFATMSEGAAEADGAAIVAAVNGDGSDVKLSADKIDLDGVTTFARTDDLAAGRTTVNGGCIAARSLSVEAIALNTDGQINFSDLGSITFSDPDSGGNGSINLSSNEYGASQLDINASEILLSGNTEVSGYLTVSGSEVVTADSFDSYLPMSPTQFELLVTQVRNYGSRIEALEDQLNPPV